MFGLGKSRTKLGRFLDRYSIRQQIILNRTGISQTTMVRLCGDQDYEPSDNVKIKIVGILRRDSYDVEMSDFWDE